jgi:hypothetical protein
MTKRKKCCRTDCKRPWTIKFKAVIANFAGGGQAVEGLFCIAHAPEAVERYQKWLGTAGKSEIKWVKESPLRYE